MEPLLGYKPLESAEPSLGRYIRPLYNLRVRANYLASCVSDIGLMVFGRPYYLSSSVVCLSVTFCIVAKRYVLAKKCLKE